MVNKTFFKIDNTNLYVLESHLLNRVRHSYPVIIFLIVKDSLSFFLSATNAHKIEVGLL